MKVAGFICDKIIGVVLLAIGAAVIVMGYQKLSNAGYYIFSKMRVDI